MYNTLIYEVVYKFHIGKVADPGVADPDPDQTIEKKTGSKSERHRNRSWIQLLYNNSHPDPTII